MEKTPAIGTHKIKIEGHIGTWYIMDTGTVHGDEYYILESEQYGDEASWLCTRYVNGVHEVVCDEFYDYDTLMDYMEQEVYNK